MDPSSPESPPTEGPPRIVSIGGGRAGVGKTLMAANLGIYLAQVGKRVVVVDADVGGANLHTLVGIPRPRLPLSAVMRSRLHSLDEALVDTAIPGLQLLSGGGDSYGVANLRPGDKALLVHEIRRLPVDYVIVDLGAGCSFSALDLFLLADIQVVVVVPEPTSIETTYRFVRSCFVRRAKAAFAGDRDRQKLIERAAISAPEGIPNPIELRDLVVHEDPEMAPRLDEELGLFRPLLTVNQTRLRSDLELGNDLRIAVARRMGIALESLGHIEYDDAAWIAVRHGKPLLVESPGAKSAKNLERIVRRILTLEAAHARRPGPRPKRVNALNHYEVLETEPGASEEEIRRAYRRMRELFSSDSLAMYALYDDERLAAAQARLTEAYDTLIDPSRRKPYDLGIFPDGNPAVPDADEARALADAGAPRPPLPDLGNDTEYTGALLHQVRMARGVDLRDVTARTKISAVYLRAIEAEDFAALPAVVYVRGFVTELAKVLHLDPPQVAKTFVRRFRQFLERAGRAEDGEG